MSLFPEVQKIAQAEIDALTKSSRLPTLEDRTNLPYVDAIVKETLRWNPVVPLGKLLLIIPVIFLTLTLSGVPHVPTQDDVFGDVLIPKGAAVLPNVWYGAFVYPGRLAVDL